MANDTNPPERPRAEPEIIPPEHDGRGQWRPIWGSYGSGQAHGTQRVYVTRVGPLGFVGLLLIVALIVAVIVVAIVGAFLLWIPLVAVLLALAAASRFLRR